MKKILTIIAGIFFLLFSLAPLYAEEAPLKLYVREGCQHCAKVKAFLNQYSLNDKVEIIETLNNQENIDKLDAEFKKYNAPQSDQGVPFMIVSDTEYLVGDQPIIKYFSDKYDIVVKEPEYKSSATDTVFMIIGGTALLAVLGYGLYSVFKKS
ncbi:glutaredoxin family protein [Candidatus Dojkabacteria bacterium]|nr:glutaredoxin family protein [Candidatus Dojkabacteria bacterium]